MFFCKKRLLNYDINTENINTFINVYLQKKTQWKLRRSLVRLLVSKQAELEFAPQFPFFWLEEDYDARSSVIYNLCWQYQ